MHHGFHESNHAGILNFDSSYPGVAARNGQCEPLEQREVKMGIQGMGLNLGKTVKDLQ